MQLLGYGEDSWTYVALKNHLGEFLDLFKDDTQDALVMYRPSFGRGQKGLGEFDFIILSSERIYLGESKMAMGAKINHKISLKDTQNKRHDCLQKVIEYWFQLPRENQSLISLLNKPLGFTIPEPSTILYKNMSSFLDLLSKKYITRPQITNILLVFSDQPINGKITSTINDFFTVNMIMNDSDKDVLTNHINMSQKRNRLINQQTIFLLPRVTHST